MVIKINEDVDGFLCLLSETTPSCGASDVKNLDRTCLDVRIDDIDCNVGSFVTSCVEDEVRYYLVLLNDLIRSVAYYG